MKIICVNFRTLRHSGKDKRRAIKVMVVLGCGIITKKSYLSRSRNIDDQDGQKGLEREGNVHDPIVQRPLKDRHPSAAG